jgi:hypothetical protein
MQSKVTIYPDKFIEMEIPENAKYLDSSEVLVTPRLNSTDDNKDVFEDEIE